MKYDKKFKLRLVKCYLDGKGSFKSIARLHGLSDAQLRRWVAAYQQHGVSGLARSLRQYDAAAKLSILRRMWRCRLSYNQTAALFDIRSPGHLGRWERQYHAEGVDALASRSRGSPKIMPAIPPPQSAAQTVPDEQRSREELLKELEYLRAENAYLKKLDALVQAKKSVARKKRN
jgi:transposase